MDKELKIIPPEGYEIDKVNSTFDCIKFKPIKPQLPKTWVEFCNNYKVQPGESLVSDTNEEGFYTFITERCRFKVHQRHLLPSQELAKAMIALCQLIQLRDCYNQGWMPDWKKGTYKTSIVIREGEAVIEVRIAVSQILTFKTPKLCEEFFKNFKDLIEIAKPLL